MGEMKRLPDAEFDVMKIIWANEPPITANIIMEQLGTQRKWKAQTVNSLLLRLVKRGFLRSEKNGKERVYFPVVSRDDYLKFETELFLKQYHNNSVINLVNTLYRDKTLTDEDIDELLQWLKKRRG
ncbi:BlaI/MecI/CopY family transcriptional regulator [Thermoclostridium stercorarium]|nr:BlaI/MecI/CopY family transcriptional regulator [Thermoclostridium stercorarium]UZQ85814.1 BlaI/MecI/CopY family transcriptional regulator [Thermoclostridium stercorarium]